MFLWGILPEHMDAAEVLKVALQAQGGLRARARPSTPPAAARTPCASTSRTRNPDTIREGITRLGTTLKELLHNGAKVPTP